MSNTTMSFDADIGCVYNINAEIMATGKTGKSAYEIWLKLGGEGTEEDFINSLKAEFVGTLSAEYVIETLNKQFINELDRLKLIGFSHDQIVASNKWIINHNMDKYPSVTVVDSAGSMVVGDVEYVSSNQIILYFIAEFSGKAYLN